ncbi:hypothetical protein [Kumtagia ephedrae]|uniref:hypothetical protein n=1 Tax=Kumtagia ephedrae TaxID=2116701 RepID=UPI001A9C4089|nr:hypothetical protein [Mesorhizobium ephedrae]
MSKRPKKYVDKVLALRARLWPDLIEDELWYHKKYDGFVTIPRTMPLIMSIIDDLTKGTPASSTYLDLWCRTFPEMYVSLSEQTKLAYGAGFTGQRARRTWQERIRLLNELGFIRVAEGMAGEFSHAVVINPHVALKRLKDQKHPGLVASKYNALLERAGEVGAPDVDRDPKAPPPASSIPF